MWRWCNWLHSCAPADKQIVRCNLDETSIKMLQEPAIGMLTAATRRLKARGLSPRKPVSRAATRTAFTYVAVCCDNMEVQAHMPQILIVNKYCYTQASHARVLLHLPDHIIVWRRPSAWMNINSVCEVIDILGKYFTSFQSTHHFILGLDAAKVHLNQKVWRRAQKHNIYLFCIPAKVTYALQPLDVYVFSEFKRRLQIICQTHAIEAGNGGATLEHTIMGVLKAVADILMNKCWTHAFSHLGLNGTQDCVSSRLLQQLENQSMPEVAVSMPEYSHLVACFPKRFDIPMDAVFGSVMKVLRAPGVGGPPVADSPPDAGPVVSPWHGRLRSNSHLALAGEVGAPAEVPAPAAPLAIPAWNPRLQLRRLPPRPPWDS